MNASHHKAEDAFELGIFPRRVQQFTHAGVLQRLRPGVY